MLILGRRPGESILIDGGIRIVVVSCDRRGVRIGIDAPTSVGIVRGGWPERGERSPVGGAKTPLLYATRQGDLELTRMLIEAGASIEQADANAVLVPFRSVDRPP